MDTTQGQDQHEWAEQLRAEAAALRRSRRLFRRIMAVYIGLAVVFIGFRIVETLPRLAPRYVRENPPSTHTSGQIGPDIHYAVRNPEDIVVGNGGAQGSRVAGWTIQEPPIQWSRAVSEFPWGIAVGVGLLGLGVLESTRRALRRQKAAAREIVKHEDVRAIGGLAESLRIDDVEIRSAASGALVRLLPHVKASDWELLDDEQHACLNRALLENDPSLCRAILSAWEQVGDERDIAAVTRVSEGEGAGRRNPDVRSLALDCLPALRVNAGKRRVESTLLRASGVVDGTGSLLRAAAESRACPDEELLRPVHGNPALPIHVEPSPWQPIHNSNGNR